MLNHAQYIGRPTILMEARQGRLDRFLSRLGLYRGSRVIFIGVPTRISSGSWQATEIVLEDEAEWRERYRLPDPSK